VPEPVADPLHFRDQKKYPDRVKAAQKSTGEKDAMLVAEGEILRTPLVAVAQDFSFMGGSMGMYVGNAIIAGGRTRGEAEAPLGAVLRRGRRADAGGHPVA
jgi:acetyl-CoA carboxylase carboxyl transferase subunit beta